MRFALLVWPLALALAACPTLAPLAKAQSPDHSCCPVAGSDHPTEKGQPVVDIAACCPAATLPSAVTAPAVAFELVALVSQAPVLMVEHQVHAWDSTGLSPPCSTDVPAVSSPRAPPVLA